MQRTGTNRAPGGNAKRIIARASSRAPCTKPQAPASLCASDPARRGQPDLPRATSPGPAPLTRHASHLSPPTHHPSKSQNNVTYVTELWHDDYLHGAI
jgi:hypothetical protein